MVSGDWQWCSNCERTLFAETSTFECPRCHAPTEPLSARIFIGRILNERYRIVRLIGQGGMGAVFEGIQISLDRTVAIKVLLPRGSMPETILHRFVREARIMAALRHPNIVEVIDFDMFQGHVPFIVMEYLKGESLRVVLQRYPHGVPLVLFVRWMEEICQGVIAAHRNGVIHRDLKPANIMWVQNPDGSHRIKILDFGLARLQEISASRAITLSGEIMGTPGYMAPEQLTGQPVDVRTDVYALGVIAFELLTGRPPFVGDTLGQIVHRVLHAPVPDPRDFRPEIPSPLVQAVTRAIARDPNDRWPSVEHFFTALKTALQDISTESETLVVTPPAAVTQPPAAPVRSTVGQRTHGHLRTFTRTFPRTLIIQRPISRTIAAFVLLGMVLGILWFLIGSRQRRATAPSRPSTTRSTHTRTARGIPLWTIADTVTIPGWHPVEHEPVPAIESSHTDAIYFLVPSGLWTWRPHTELTGPVRMTASPGSILQCGARTWLVQPDTSTIVEMDLERFRTKRPIHIPLRFHLATCAGTSPARIGLFNRDQLEWTVWDADRHRIRQTLHLPPEHRPLGADPHGRYLATIDDQGVVWIHSIHRTDWTPLRIPVMERLTKVLRWSPDGRSIVFGFKHVYVYDVQQRRLLTQRTLRGWLVDAGWPTRTSITAVDDRGLIYWDNLRSPDWTTVRPPPKPDLYSARWMESQRRWVIADRSGRMTVYDFMGVRFRRRMQVHRLEIWSLAFSPDGSLVAVTGKAPVIRIVDIEQGKPVRTLEGHTDGVPYARWVRQNTLITVGDDATFRIWDPLTGRLQKTIHAHQSLINAFATTSDRRWLVTVSSDRMVKVWQYPDTVLIRDVLMTRDSGASVAFLAGNDRYLLIGDWTGDLYLLRGEPPDWHLDSTRHLRVDVIYAICPAHRGWWVVAIDGPDRGLWWFSPSGGLDGRRVIDAPVQYCQSSRNGRWTVVGMPGEILLLDNLHRRKVHRIAFARYDGYAVGIQVTGRKARLVYGTTTGEIFTWDVPLPEYKRADRPIRGNRTAH